MSQARIAPRRAPADYSRPCDSRHRQVGKDGPAPPPRFARETEPRSARAGAELLQGNRHRCFKAPANPSTDRGHRECRGSYERTATATSAPAIIRSWPQPHYCSITRVTPHRGRQVRIAPAVAEQRRPARPENEQTSTLGVFMLSCPHLLTAHVARRKPWRH